MMIIDYRKNKNDVYLANGIRIYVQIERKNRKPYAVHVGVNGTSNHATFKAYCDHSIIRYVKTLEQKYCHGKF